MVRYAAVLGTEVDEAALDGLLEKHDARVSRGALTRLADFLVRDQPGRLRFRNALLRDVAYEGLPFSRRRILHDQVGQAIEQASADPESQCELLSLHYFHAARHEQAWRFSVLAGERALAKFAHGEAIAFFERAAGSAHPSLALEPVEVARVLEQLADSRFVAGLSQEAGEAYALARRQLRGDAVRLAGIIEKEARIDHRRRRFTQAMQRISRGLHGLDGIPGRPAEVARSLLARRYAYSRFSQGRIDEALHWAEMAARAAEEAVDRDALAQAYEMLNAIYAGSGREEQLPYGRLALQAYTELGNLPRQGHCLNNLAVQAFTAGEWDQALASYREATDLFRRIGDTASEGNALYNQAELLVCQHRYDEAALLLPGVLRIARGGAGRRAGRAGAAGAGSDDGGSGRRRRSGRPPAAHAGRFDDAGGASRGAGHRPGARRGPARGRASRGGRRGARPGRRECGAGDGASPTMHRLIGRHHASEDRLDEARLMLLAGLEVARRETNRFEEGLLLLELAALGPSGGERRRGPRVPGAGDPRPDGRGRQPTLTRASRVSSR